MTEGWHRVGQVSDVSEDEPLGVKVGEQEIGVLERPVHRRADLHQVVGKHVGQSDLGGSRDGSIEILTREGGKVEVTTVRGTETSYKGAGLLSFSSVSLRNACSCSEVENSKDDRLVAPAAVARQRNKKIDRRYLFMTSRYLASIRKE